MKQLPIKLVFLGAHFLCILAQGGQPSEGGTGSRQQTPFDNCPVHYIGGQRGDQSTTIYPLYDGAKLAIFPVTTKPPALSLYIIMTNYILKGEVEGTSLRLFRCNNKGMQCQLESEGGVKGQEFIRHEAWNEVTANVKHKQITISIGHAHVMTMKDVDSASLATATWLLGWTKLPSKDLDPILYLAQFQCEEPGHPLVTTGFSPHGGQPKPLPGGGFHPGPTSVSGEHFPPHTPLGPFPPQFTPSGHLQPSPRPPGQTGHSGAQSGFPHGNPDTQPGFPFDQPGHPGDQPGFPHDRPGQPGAQPGFPHDRPGQPGAQPGFPHDQPGQPGAQPGFPHDRPDQPGAQPGFPHNQPGLNPDFPGSQTSYPNSEHHFSTPLPHKGSEHHPHHEETHISGNTIGLIVGIIIAVIIIALIIAYVVTAVRKKKSMAITEQTKLTKQAEQEQQEAK